MTEHTETKHEREAREFIEHDRGYDRTDDEIRLRCGVMCRRPVRVAIYRQLDVEAAKRAEAAEVAARRAAHTDTVQAPYLQGPTYASGGILPGFSAYGESYIPPMESVERTLEKVRAFAAGGVDPAVAADSRLVAPPTGQNSAIDAMAVEISEALAGLGIAGPLCDRMANHYLSELRERHVEIGGQRMTLAQYDAARRYLEGLGWSARRPETIGDDTAADILEWIPEQHRLDVVKALIPELGTIDYADAYDLCSAVAGVVNSEDGREQMVVGYDARGVVHLGSVIVTQSQYAAVRDDLLKQLGGQAR